jgi:hypothetical protein
MVLAGSGMNRSAHEAGAGALASVVARTATAPLDLLRVRQQVHGLALRRAARDLTVRVAFRGNAMSCARAAPAGAVQFALYARLRARGASRVRAALSAGVASVTLLYPLDLWKTVWQTADASELRDATAQLRRLSARRLASGYAMSVLAFVPFFTTQFVLYGSVKERVRPSGMLQLALCSGAATLPAVALCYPLDTLRRRAQVGRPSTRRLYAGFGVACAKITPQMTLRMVLYELLTRAGR